MSRRIKDMDARTPLKQVIAELRERRAAEDRAEARARELRRANAAFKRMLAAAGIKPKRRRAPRDEPEVVTAETVRWMREQGVERVSAWYREAFGYEPMP